MLTDKLWTIDKRRRMIVLKNEKPDLKRLGALNLFVSLDIPCIIVIMKSPGPNGMYVGP